MIGASEARAIEAVGRAEAEKMRMKASAYKQYGDAAIMALVLEALPQIAAEVAAPLAKTDEIVLLGGADRTTTEVNKLLGELSIGIITYFKNLFDRPLVLDTVSVSDTFKMYLYRHIDTFFMENVSVYQYVSCCQDFF